MRAIRPSPGVWDWQAYDALVAGETAHGLQILAVLTAPPLWASDSNVPYESWPAPVNLHLPWNHPDNHWA